MLEVSLFRMISCKKKSKPQRPYVCPKCGESGITKVFRNDWEEYDEIESGNCSSLRD